MVWAVIIIANQIFIFGACFAPYCILAALPHTSIIAAILIFWWVKKEEDYSLEQEAVRRKKDREKFDQRIREFEETLAAEEQQEVKKDNYERFKKPETSTSETKQSLPTEKVYITRANEAKILAACSDQPYGENFSNLYEQSLEFILSKPELSLLKIYKAICEDPRRLLDAYKKIYTYDSKNYVWEGSKPAYHFDKQCPRLNAEFTNLLIPEEIKHKGDRAIDNFRVFTKNHRDVLEHDEEIFLKKLEAKFALKNPPKSLKFENSGIKNIENYSLEQLKQKIEELLLTAKTFRNKDEYTADLIKKLGYGTHKVKGAREPENPLYTWHRYKVELKNLLKQYYRVRFNHELKFEETLLEQVGFNPCEYCKKAN